MNRFSITFRFLCLGLLLFAAPAMAKGKIKVFILAGQSNMEGHGQVSSLEHLGNHPKYGGLLKKLKSSDGSWAVRKDVTVAWKSREGKKKGPLCVGWGAEDQELGPELMFGTVMGDLPGDFEVIVRGDQRDITYGSGLAGCVG